MRSAVVVVSLFVTVVLAGAAQSRQDSKEAFTAVALSAGGLRGNPVAGQIEIVIERWSTDGERERLLGAVTKGQSELLETLRDLPSVGTVRTPGSLAWDLRYAAQRPGEDGGRRIVLATDRPISAWEAVNQPRTTDYPFTFIELRVDKNGVGEGKLSRATRVTASDDGRFVQLENWETQPIDLTQVKPRR